MQAKAGGDEKVQENAGPGHTREPEPEGPEAEPNTKSLSGLSSFEYGVARSRAMHRKIRWAAERLADSLGDQDTADDIRVIREAKNAMREYYDPEAGRIVKAPDHKIRIAAVQFSRAYVEGLPVQKQITVAAGMDQLSAVLGGLKESPEALRMLQAMAGDVIDVQSEVLRLEESSEAES
jgi:hypothetical protein